MSVRVHQHLGLAFALIATCLPGLAADESSPKRSTPVIFSAPRSDTVSSNLNRIGPRSSPLTDLESGLKKPFEIFDSKSSQGEFRSPMNYTPQLPPAPVLNNKKLKDLLDKRAEDRYLLQEDGKTALDQDNPFNSGEDPFNTFGKRPKTSLDRYYDRVEQSRSALTNQTRTTPSLDLFGEKLEKDEKDENKSRLAGGLFGDELSPTARAFGQMSNSLSTTGGWLNPSKSKAGSFGDLFGLGPVEPTQTADKKQREKRLDEFKRLLDGPGYGARNDFNVNPPSSANTPYQYQPAKPTVGVPSPIFSSASPSAPGASLAGTPSFTGVPGTPNGVRDFAVGSPSLTPTPALPPVSTAPAVPAFNVPRRRF